VVRKVCDPSMKRRHLLENFFKNNMFIIYFGLILSKSGWKVMKKIEICLKEYMKLI
jgi:hypothetical protein